VPGRSPTASACEPCFDFIEPPLSKGRNAKAIYQDLVDDHGFTGRYQTVCLRRGGRGNVEPVGIGSFDSLQAPISITGTRLPLRSAAKGSTTSLRMLMHFATATWPITPIPWQWRTVPSDRRRQESLRAYGKRARRFPFPSFPSNKQSQRGLQYDCGHEACCGGTGLSKTTTFWKAELERGSRVRDAPDLPRRHAWSPTGSASAMDRLSAETPPFPDGSVTIMDQRGGRQQCGYSPVTGFTQ
jgi:hypothetical protein